MSRWTLILGLLIAVFITAAGCSNGGNPINPGTQNELTANNYAKPSSQTHLWGYYDVYIDIPTQTATAVLNRTAMFAANVVTFVNGKPANLQFSIKGTPLGTDYVDVDIDVTITHPFPGMNQYDGYDVRGIFIGNGSATMKYNTDLKYAKYGTSDQVMYDYNVGGYSDPDGAIGMPDGYTRWFNQPEFGTPGVLGYTQGKYATPKYTSTATLNPYKYFADTLGKADDLWTFLNSTTGYGKFSAGSSNTRNYYLRFPNATGVKFGYSIVANWIDETTHPANADEAMAVKVTVTPDVYWVPPTGDDKGGKLKLTIDVFDWNAQPSAIWVESTVLNNPYQFTPAQMTPIGGTSTYSTYYGEVAADNITSTGGQEFWVIAETGTKDYTNTFGVPNLAGNDTLAAFFRYDLYVSPTPYCKSLLPVPNKLNGKSIFLALAGNYTAWEVTGSGFEDGPGLAVYVKSGTTTVASGTNVKFVDANKITFDVDLTGVAAGLYNIVVKNGCGDMKEGTGTGLLGLLRTLAVVGTPNIDISTGFGTPTEICCDAGANRSAIAYNNSLNWIVRWDNTYATSTVLLQSPIFGNANWSGPIGRMDCASAGTTPDSNGTGINFAVVPGAGMEPSFWAQMNWNGQQGVPVGYGNAQNPPQNYSGYLIWRQNAFRKIMDFCNVQNGQNVAVIHHWAYATNGADTTPWDAISESWLWDGTQSVNWLFEISWPTGSTPSQWCNADGTAGVWPHRILGTGMAPGPDTQRMQWILEKIPATNTAVVELWNINQYPVSGGVQAPGTGSNPPVYGGISWGEGFLYDARDLDVDSLGNVYVLEKNATGGTQIWVLNSSGQLIGWSGVLTTAQCSGEPVAIDVSLFANPNELHFLHTKGVTRFRLL